MQKPARAYGMTKVEYQRRLHAFEAAQAGIGLPRESLFARFFKRR